MNLTSPRKQSTAAPPSGGAGLIVVAIARPLRAFFAPRGDAPAGASVGLAQLREQLLTVVARAGAGLGLLAFAAAAPALAQQALFGVLAVGAAVLAAIWFLAVSRRLGYRLRAGLLLLGLYALGVSELLHFGYSEDAYSFLVGFCLLALLLFGARAGAGALALGAGTLAAVGWQISAGEFAPLSFQLRSVSASTVITTCTIFLTVVGTLQLGIAALFAHLERAWQAECAARAALKRERHLLERRVAERTAELAVEHARAVAASRAEMQQKEYLVALHQTALDLLNHREVTPLLQAIVERAAAILRAPYGELMLIEGGELVVHAFTNNQPFLAGDRVGRAEALLSWQAYDTGQPVVLDDYSAWQARRNVYASIQLRAVADFPIVVGEQCLGVLAMGRVEPGDCFTPEDTLKGLMFSRLAALVLDNAHLYEIALHEIDERKQTERALQQYAEELRAHNAELDAFAHTVAHDLKTPLTSLIGYNQLLRLSYATLSPEQLAEIFDTVARSGRKMSAIIDGLLLLARERARDAVPIGALNMAEIVAELEIRLRDMVVGTGAVIVKPAAWPPALGYAPWVEEVWFNYISNAIKYGGAPPRVALGACEPAGGFVRFWVRDNGCGLDAAEQAQLFIPFARLHMERAEGHGLGLSIVQRIVHRLGGEVGVESEPGQGSLFYFTLPAANGK